MEHHKIPTKSKFHFNDGVCSLRILLYSQSRNVSFYDIFLAYVILLLGKSTIILITRVDQSFQTPMYFFLSDIFFLEICYVSVTLSIIFINLWTQKSILFFFAHVTKVCFIFMLRNTECFLLMVCDRHVAICHILLMVLNHEPCIWLMMTGCWMSGIPVTLGQTWHLFSLPFSGFNQTNHFFCDILPMLKLARGDTFLKEMLVLTVVLLMMIPFLLTLGSYSKIIYHHEVTNAFSSCSFHNICGCILCIWNHYVFITQIQTLFQNRQIYLSFLHIFTLMFNPMIYILRNKDVMMVLRKCLS